MSFMQPKSTSFPGPRRVAGAVSAGAEDPVTGDVVSAPATASKSGTTAGVVPPLAEVIQFPAGRRRVARMQDREAGMATAEYAIATLAAVAFAALLVAVLSSGDVRELLMSLIRAALSFG